MIAVTEGSAPGEAVLRFDGAAAALGAPGIRIQRDAEWAAHTLGPAGWQTADAVLQPRRAEAAGPDLLVHVGWEVCQYLEGGVYLISLPAAGLGPAGVYWPDIAPGVAAPVAPAPPTPAPAPEAVRPLPGVAAVPVAPPVPPAKRGVVLPLLGLLVLLAVAAGGAWYWLHRAQPPAEATAVEPPAPPPAPPEPPPPPPAPPPEPPPAPPPPPPPPPPEPPPPPPPPPLDLTRLSVPEVLAQAPNLGAVVTEGQRRLGSTQKDDGLLLLEAAADKGDGPATAAIARLYDPVLFQPGGPIPRADPRQAARYYRDAARLGQDVTAAREALRQWLLAHTSMTNELILKDFWP